MLHNLFASDNQVILTHYLQGPFKMWTIVNVRDVLYLINVDGFRITCCSAMKFEMNF